MMHQETFTVYVIDDDASIRKALERLLRSAGYHALTFESGEDFLQSLPAYGQGCLILDIRLPGISGLDLHEKLASQGKKYPVIFMTAHDNRQWREWADRTDAVAYLKKPFPEKDLLDAVRLGSARAI